MDPLAFRQSSPPTRLGRRVVGDLILKAGLVGPKGESVASVPKPAMQTSMPATHQMSLPLGSSPTAPTSKPKTTGPQLSIPGTEPHQQGLPGMGEPSKIASPSAPKPVGGGIVTPGPQARPGAKISPVTAVGGASARTPAEHQAAQGMLTPPPSKPQPQYGPKMTQGVPRATGQASLPGVAVHQQAMRGGAGTQLEIPGGAAMHSPTGPEAAPKMDTIGQATDRHRKTFGSNPSQMTRPGEAQELQSAASAKPMQAEGGQMLLPGTATSGRKAQAQAAQKLQAKQGEQGRENVRPGQQMELGSHVTKEQGPATEVGKVGQTMRSGTLEERRAAIKQSAAGMRERAEASGRQQPKAAQQPGFKPAQAGTDHHSSLSDYHGQMAEHHQHLMGQATKAGDHDSAAKHKMAFEAHQGAAQLHGNQTKANAASEKASKLTGSKAPEGADPEKYHQQMAQHHLQQHQMTGDPRHQMAASSHSQAADLHSSAGSTKAIGHSDTAEKLSDAAGVKGELTKRVEHTKPSGAFGHDQPLSAAGTAGGAGAVGRAGAAGGAGGTRVAGSQGTRGGRPMKGSSRYGVAGPNIAGNFGTWYGAGLGMGSLAGPASTIATGLMAGAGKLQSLASTRNRGIPGQQQKDQARDANSAAIQRQQQLIQMQQIANKAMIELTPSVRSGTRRIG